MWDFGAWSLLLCLFCIYSALAIGVFRCWKRKGRIASNKTSRTLIFPFLDIITCVYFSPPVSTTTTASVLDLGLCQFLYCVLHSTYLSHPLSGFSCDVDFIFFVYIYMIQVFGEVYIRNRDRKRKAWPN